jgi:hypothetical protein
MAAFITETSLTYTDFGTSYDSYFITGPSLRGEGARSQNEEYFTVYANVIENGSVYVRGRWDWADESNTGKWSTEQQGYTANRAFRDVSRRRLLMRGSGPALQLQFRSEAGKPFELIGWAMFESVDGVP